MPCNFKITSKLYAGRCLRRHKNGIKNEREPERRFDDSMSPSSGSKHRIELIKEYTE